MFGVCLSVCLLATLHKTTVRIFMNILPQIYLQTRKNLSNFGRHPLLDSDPGIFKDSSTLRDGAFFHNLAHISGHTDQIFMKILLQM